MIILEGPDNAGKTTLGVRLQRDLVVALVHSPKPNPERTPDQALAKSNSQLLPDRHILDRVYVISEWVYGPICRGGSALDNRHSKALECLLNQEHLIIYCRPPTQVILRNNGREQMDGVLENHERIIQKYDEIMEELPRYGNCQVIEYDWTDITHYPTLLGKCKKYLHKTDQIRQSAFYLGAKR